jgi:hypothetical protein
MSMPRTLRGRGKRALPLRKPLRPPAAAAARSRIGDNAAVASARQCVRMVVAAVAVPLEAAAWQVVNDDVMGGVSRSAVRALPDGGLCFEGVLSLDYGGGFASARCAWTPPRAAASAAAFALRVRGDGRLYRLTVFVRDATSGQRAAHQWQAPFAAPPGESVHEVPIAACVARYRGRPVAAPPLAVSAILAVGLQIADRQAGPFALELLSLALVTSH